MISLVDRGARCGAWRALTLAVLLGATPATAHAANGEHTALRHAAASQPAERIERLTSGAVAWRSDTLAGAAHATRECATAAPQMMALPPLLTSAATAALVLLAGLAVRRRRANDHLATGAALRDARAELGQVERRTEAFLAMLAHELRGPLAPIRNAVNLLQQVELQREPRLARVCGILERQVTYLARMVDDLVDAARVSHNLIALRCARVALVDVVDDAVELTRAAVTRGGHQLVVMHADIGLRVRGDRSRLTQVVAALLDNAARFTPPGGHITLATERDGGVAQVTVRDDGVGIAAEAQARIFELFAQEHVTLARSGGGLGIGLALVRQLVALHGGTVEVESAPGIGSAFRVRLPAE